MNQVDPKVAFSLRAIAGLTDDHFVPEAEVPTSALSPEAVAVARQLSARPLSGRLLAGLARLFEFVAIVLLGVAIHQLYVEPAEWPTFWYGATLIGGAALSVLLVQAGGGYEVPALRASIRPLGSIFTAWTAVIGCFALAMFFTKTGEDFSRVWFGSWYLSVLAFYAIYRPVLASAVRRWTREGRLERRAVIVGGGPAAEKLIRALEQQEDSDIRICGLFDDRKDARSPSVVAGYPKLGNVSELVAFCRMARIDMLIVALPITAEARLLDMLHKLWVLPVDIRLSTQSNRIRFRPRSYSFVGTEPFLDVFDRPIADWDYIVKRGFDLVIASLAIVLLSPLMVATAIAIRLESPGPVLFRQKRYGFNNEVIEVLKFRSMYHHLADPTAKVVVTRNDPRVTRVGRIIRKTSIDELPQLFNVLQGTLSLVGPRPHAVNAHTANKLWERVVDGYFARHRVRPGVTGWAQVNGWRGEVDTPEKIRGRVEHDLYYIENWSVLFDLYILAITPLRLLKGENAF